MDAFPSLGVSRDALVPHGPFAEAQAAFLHPDPAVVADVRAACEAHAVGIVAHFYMDAELQGVLVRVGAPHTFVADSLQMADVAVKMAEAGKRTIVVLGVDFMSENVRAVLDNAGHRDVDVFRLSSDKIGCSLAESADTPAYLAWLGRLAGRPDPLHVVYINTSLLTKAHAHAIVPTLTCTSSNVVQSILQAAAQVPGVSIGYGPDTYMGANLEVLLRRLADQPDDAIRAVHPAHDRASIARLLHGFDHYRQGACVVHHLFGDDVVERVKARHADALLTAHLEVPGGMFALAAEAQRHGRGVVGSTSNILEFILKAVATAAGKPGPQRVEVVLGTESGMITSIVSRVQDALRTLGRDDITLEVVFPVASEAVTRVEGSPLALVPGPAAGEGCSIEGGCATCPYMKMNSLHALQRVLAAVGAGRQATLAAFRPALVDAPVMGPDRKPHPASDLGAQPILAMRHFQRTGALPESLVARVRGEA